MFYSGVDFFGLRRSRVEGYWPRPRACAPLARAAVVA